MDGPGHLTRLQGCFQGLKADEDLLRRNPGVFSDQVTFKGQDGNGEVTFSAVRLVAEVEARINHEEVGRKRRAIRQSTPPHMLKLEDQVTELYVEFLHLVEECADLAGEQRVVEDRWTDMLNRGVDPWTA